MNAACHFNILTECSEITFQILKCHTGILSEQFLNSISYASTKITTVLCYLALLGELFFNYFKSLKNHLLKIKTI